MQHSEGSYCDREHATWSSVSARQHLNGDFQGLIPLVTFHPRMLGLEAERFWPREEKVKELW